MKISSIKIPDSVQINSLKNMPNEIDYYKKQFSGVYRYNIGDV